MNRVFLLFLGIFLSGCGGFPYQPSSISYDGLEGTGYSDKQVGDNTYEIKVMGYSNTEESLFTHYLHKRSIEICGASYQYLGEPYIPIVVISGVEKQPRVSHGKAWTIKCVSNT